MIFCFIISATESELKVDYLHPINSNQQLYLWDCCIKGLFGPGDYIVSSYVLTFFFSFLPVFLTVVNHRNKNGFFFRSEVKKLIIRLKTEGLIVDGKHYRVEFKGNCKQYG